VTAPHTRLSETPLRLLLRWAGCLILAAGIAWGTGFGWFLHRARQATVAPVHADGIVALTGGADRIETALHLLAERHARMLLLSGIGGGAELAELARRAGLDPAPWAAQVTLGRKATSTKGNAAETADWARENGVRSLIVVTAGYHMPRAITELGRAMPEVALYPVAVVPPGMQGPGGLHDSGMLRLMAEEYTKWLVARLGLSVFDSRHEAEGASAVTRTSREGRPPVQDRAG
jgi:uncharacterized SAM-binding protein YcdF (DUF218 family)